MFWRRMTVCENHSDTMSFEENMNRLGQIVALLERGDAKLADSLALFEEGTRLVSDRKSVV